VSPIHISPESGPVLLRDISSSNETIVIRPTTEKIRPKIQIAPKPIWRCSGFFKKSLIENRRPTRPCHNAASNSTVSNDRQSGFDQRLDTKSNVVSEGTLM
jgi:hypothetical protein